MQDFLLTHIPACARYTGYPLYSLLSITKYWRLHSSCSSKFDLAVFGCLPCCQAKQWRFRRQQFLGTEYEYLII